MRVGINFLRFPNLFPDQNKRVHGGSFAAEIYSERAWR